MNISARIIGAASVALLLIPFSASAQLVISEIMYDLQTGADTGREWIEVFNATYGTIPITEWKVLEGGSNHSISAVQGGDTLSSGGYAIIADNPAKFLADWPGYSGALYDTAFSGGLSNSGESITVGYMKDGALISTDTVVYQSAWGGAGDGMSLVRDTSEGTGFAGGAPTPGSGVLLVVPGLHPPSSTTETPESTETSTSTTQSPQSHTTVTNGVVSSYVPPPEPMIYAYIGKDRDVIAGADVVYEGQAYDKKGNWLSASTTRFAWNFGDGNVADGPVVLHHFSIPGRYAVVLNVVNAIDVASAKIAVNVHPVAISLTEQSGAIVLTNASGFELDLSRWLLASLGTQFVLPAGTTLLPRSSAAFSASTTRITNTSHAQLLYPNGTLASAMGSKPAPVPVQVAKPIAPKKKSVVPTRSRAANEQEVKQTEVETESSATTSALTAAVGTSQIAGYGWWLGAGVLALGAGAITALISRSRKGEWLIEEEE